MELFMNSDVKKLRELCASKANMVDHGDNSDGHGPMISQINGRTLLLFYYGNVNMGYQIVTYKDITDVIEKKSSAVFSDGWIYFIFDRGDGNYPLFEPSKNHSTAYRPKRSYASCF
ncbi:hypothetical protein M5E86_19130 [Blautia wexlerae]|nr:hypothetical protein M5E86_19130 [Blautia wexlerae]